MAEVLSGELLAKFAKIFESERQAAKIRLPWEQIISERPLEECFDFKTEILGKK